MFRNVLPFHFVKPKLNIPKPKTKNIISKTE